MSSGKHTDRVSKFKGVDRDALVKAIKRALMDSEFSNAEYNASFSDIPPVLEDRHDVVTNYIEAKIDSFNPVISMKDRLARLDATAQKMKDTIAYNFNDAVTAADAVKGMEKNVNEALKKLGIEPIGQGQGPA